MAEASWKHSPWKPEQQDHRDLLRLHSPVGDARPPPLEAPPGGLTRGHWLPAAPMDAPEFADVLLCHQHELRKLFSSLQPSPHLYEESGRARLAGLSRGLHELIGNAHGP